MTGAAPLTALRSRFSGVVTRAFSEFLTLPVVVVAGFIGLAVGTYALDDWTAVAYPRSGIVRWLAAMFGDPGAMSSLLATVATSIITVTSITFSLLLLAVQQGAASLTSQVYDQFLRRRWNQFHFGFFVGLSVFVLMNLVTISSAHRPIFGTLIALVLTAISLCMIVLLIYNTIDQMRPSAIVGAIHDHVLRSRNPAAPLLTHTRRVPRPGAAVTVDLAARVAGVVSNIDIVRLRKELAALSESGDLELELRAWIGTYVAFRDPWLRVRADRSVPDDLRERISETAASAISFEEGRDLTRDPCFGIEQLATIAWTSISTARSNPQPGILVIRALRDILARWGADWPLPEDRSSSIIYSDRVPSAALDALENCIVVASESMQSQTLAELVTTLAILLGHMPPPVAARLDDMVLRALSSLGEHVLTRDLESGLDDLVAALNATAHFETAAAVSRARLDLGRSIGGLNSRSTRVPESTLNGETATEPYAAASSTLPSRLSR